ncbi:MAG: hypothetical protein V1761_04185 [bacterium]
MVSPKKFIIMKAIGIVLIPVTYFVYSPFLGFIMAYFVVLFFLAIGCEHSLNKSVIRSNHIKIPKYDSAIALLLLSASFFKSAFSASSGGIGRFANTLMQKITSALTNFGSLQTGFRSVFGKTQVFRFGPMDKPEGFIPDREAFMDQIGSMPPGGRPGGVPDFEVSMDAIPIEFMFSQVYSTIATVLIVMVGVFGAISLIHTIHKIRKFEIEQNEVIVDGEIKMLSEADLTAIMSFGDVVETYES